MKMTIYVYSHSFVVSTVERRFKQILAAFIRNRLTVEKFKIGKGDPGKKVFAASNPTRTQIFFHINLFEQFKQMLLSQGVRTDEYEIVYKKPKKGKKIEVKFIAPYAMSELQNRCLDFIRDDRITAIAPLQTGKGKTALGLYFMCEYGRRTLITMNAKYIPRWVQDLTGEKAVVDLEESDVLVVKGLIQLKKYVLLAKTKQLPDFKVMLISNTTLYMFYKDFTDHPEEWKEYGLKVPQDLYSLFELGFRIRDEFHEDIHFNCKFDTFTHVSKALDLSATIIYDDPGLERISQLISPIADRFNQGRWDTYTEVYATIYRINMPTKLRWQMGWNGPYNHNELEKSILKIPIHKNNFMKMVTGLTHELFVEDYKEGQRCLIYASTKEMCTLLSAHLAEEFPSLFVHRYIGEDEYEELLTGDIVVSTPKSAGTGVDIPGLVRVIDTVNTSSTQANIQKIGRLRKPTLTDDDGNPIVPKYYYTTCAQIPQHVKYHYEKQSKLRGFVKSLQTYDTTYKL